MNHGTITFANPAFTSIVGQSASELQGREIFELVDEGQGGPREPHGKPRQGFFSRINIRTVKGTKILEGNFHFIEERPGTSVALLRDVTDKVALERRLLRQNQDLAAVNLISKTLSSSIDLGGAPEARWPRCSRS